LFFFLLRFVRTSLDVKVGDSAFIRRVTLLIFSCFFWFFLPFVFLFPFFGFYSPVLFLTTVFSSQFWFFLRLGDVDDEAVASLWIFLVLEALVSSTQVI